MTTLKWLWYLHHQLIKVFGSLENEEKTREAKYTPGDRGYLFCDILKAFAQGLRG